MAKPSPTVLEIRAEVQNLKGLNQLKSALRNIGTEADNSSNKLVDYTHKIKKFAASTGNSVNSLEAQKRAFEALRRSVDVTSKEFAQATKEIDLLDKKLAKVEGRRPSGQGGLGGIAKGVGAIAAGGVFGGFEGAVGGAIGLGLGGPAGAAVGAALGAQVGAFRQAMGGAAEYAAELSKLRIALRGVTDSQAEYDAALSIVQDATKDYAIPQEVLTKQFLKLQASVKGAGGNLQDTRKAFDGVVAAVRATGGSLTDIDAALTATAQVFSKGKVSAEELRQQLGERLPGAFTLFAESMGKTPAELDKALELGKVSLQDFQKFAELLLEKYGDTARIIADGPDAAGDRLKVTLASLKESVGTFLKPIGVFFQETFTASAGFVDTLIRKLNDLNGLTIKGVQDKLQEQLNRKDRLEELLDPERNPFAFASKVDREQRMLALARVNREIDRLDSRLELLAEANDAKNAPDTPSNLPDAGGTTPKGKSQFEKDTETAAGITKRLTRGIADLALNLSGIGASAEEAIEVKYKKAIASATNKTTDLREAISELTTLSSEDQQVLTDLVDQYGESLERVAKRQRDLASDELFAKKLKERFKGLSFDKLDYGGVDADAGTFTQGVDFLNPMTEKITKVKDELAELANPVNAISAGAQNIADSFSTAFTNVISGSQSAREALAGFFESLASTFLKTAQQIITKLIVITALNKIAQVLPSGNSISGKGTTDFFNTEGIFSSGGDGIGGFGSGLKLDSFSAPSFLNSADGGPVMPGKPYMVGERGAEMFVPFQRGQVLSKEQTEEVAQAAFSSNSVTNNFQQMEAMQVPFTKTSETASQESMRQPLDIRYESTVVNGVEYVTAEQHRKGMAQAAERGRDLSLEALQNSVKARRKVAI